jgi:NAD(P)H-nitrite reductase large subunit
MAGRSAESKGIRRLGDVRTVGLLWGVRLQSAVMQPDDQICYCYHVPLRKLVNYARRERPARASQMSECLGAGTGCGWCIPFLIKIANDPDGFALKMCPEEYAESRRGYIKSGQPKNEF